MYKLVVLTDPDTADGFRLAGVDVEVVDSAREAREQLASLVDDDESGIIAVNERLMAAIDERLQKKIDSIYRPIVVSLPIREKLAGGRGPPRVPVAAHPAGDRIRHHTEARIDMIVGTIAKITGPVAVADGMTGARCTTSSASATKASWARSSASRATRRRSRSTRTPPA